MRKVILFFIVSGIIIIACNKKSIPVITERKTEPFKPVTTNTSNVVPDTLIGKTIYINKCGRCHELFPLNQYTSKRWDEILSYMIPKAKLNDEQAVHVIAYVHTGIAK